MNKPVKILVLGATGQVGGAALDFLNDKSGIDVFGATRYDQKKEAIEKRGAVARVVDLDDSVSLDVALEGMDSLLLVTGYSVQMLHQSLRILDAAKRHDVQTVVHIGASESPTSEVAHWGWHRMIEAYIQRHGFQFTHLHPESFMQNLVSFGWLQEDTISNLLGKARWSWVDARDVGAMAGAALLAHESLVNRSVGLGYEAFSIPEIAEMLENEFNRRLQITPVAPDDFYRQAIAAGAEPVYMACVRDQLKLNREGRIPESDKTFEREFFAKIVGRPPSSLREYLSEHVGAPPLV